MKDHRRREPPGPVHEADSLSNCERDLELCSYTAFKAKLSVMKDHENEKEAKMLSKPATINEWNPKRDLLARTARKSVA
jgi:hypothetical protein